MEIRAPYVIVGAFVLAAIAAVFGFVYWLNNAGGLGKRETYRVQFDAPVSGLLVGAAVLFNGIRVGEVTALRLPEDKPRSVLATISVAAATPVKRDTKVGLEFQGLTGVPVIALEGGSDNRVGVEPGTALVADPMASQSMTVAARNALVRVDNLIADNSGNLSDIISNLKVFAAALGKNSDRIDGILAGVEKMTGGGPTPLPKTIYDLTAPISFPTVGKLSTTQLAIPEPTASLQLDSQRILKLPSEGDPAFADAQWADSIPKLVQARLVQAFENFDIRRGVAKDSQATQSDEQLLLDIRRFQVSVANPASADVAITAKLVSKDGRILSTRIFEGSENVGQLDAKSAAAAIDRAFGRVAVNLVAWVSEAR